jgi:hypothetical protein
MGEIVHTSRIRIVREKGPTRRAMIEGFNEPIYYGVHGGIKRFYKMVILMGLTIVLLCPGLVLSDCMDFGRSTSFYVQGGHSIIFYSGLMPIARVEVPYCALSPSSSVSLMKSYVCDGDNIMIDGSKCTIMTVSSASTGPF